MNTCPTLSIGIDVSKATLDACLLRPGAKPLSKQFPNEPAGHAKLVRWAQHFGEHPLHFCLEATGRHSEALALFLVEIGQTVSVENPARIKHFGIGIGALNKTDKADAKVIALFCQMTQPAPWRMSAPEVRELVALLRRWQSLKDLILQEQNRLTEPQLPPPVQQSLQESIRFLSAQAQQIKDQIDQHLKKHPPLQADKELLESIPGIGEIAALWILAELPDVSQFASAQSAAAYAGLSPQEHRSGTSIRGKTRLSKAGNPHLRRALYMPALCAARFNPRVADLYRRLRERGLCRMAAIGACMRKLLMICYGVLKNRTNFVPIPAENAA